ncbi:putative ovochymase [Ixodes scapularis]
MGSMEPVQQLVCSTVHVSSEHRQYQSWSLILCATCHFSQEQSLFEGPDDPDVIVEYFLGVEFDVVLEVVREVALEILQKVDLPIVSFEECRYDYRNQNDLVEDSMICAGVEEGGKSLCHGDAGGPLQCPRADGRYVLAGTTSWGDTFGYRHQPTVFARTSTQLDWIKSVAGETP